MNKTQLKPQLHIIMAALLPVLIISLILFFLLYHSRQKEQPVIHKKLTGQFAYNIRLDSLNIQYGKVGRSQNLSDILIPYVQPKWIDRIAKETNDVFDVRKMHSGNTWVRIFTKDSTHRTLYFIYESNSIEFVVYDFRDSLRVYRGKKNVTIKERTAAGRISSSLWKAFEGMDLDFRLEMALADIFAWTVDFYGIQKGDAFKVIYEETYVDNRMVGINRVRSACFRSNNKDYYAFLYEVNGKKEYFDENGQSLQRSFLKAPLKFTRISSRFSRSRIHPILRIARPHFGVDYAAPRGTPVVALGDGKVTEAGWKGGYGRHISIRHNSIYLTSYAHLSGYAKNLKAGTHVSQGEVIGYVGSSGLATGPHLDFRVYKNGEPVDPLHLESPRSDPVPAQELSGYKLQSGRWKTRLDSLNIN